MTISEWDDRYRVADRVAALEREVASLSRRLEAAVDVLLKLPDDDADAALRFAAFRPLLIDGCNPGRSPRDVPWVCRIHPRGSA